MRTSSLSCFCGVLLLSQDIAANLSIVPALSSDSAAWLQLDQQLSHLMQPGQAKIASPVQFSRVLVRSAACFLVGRVCCLLAPALPAL